MATRRKRDTGRWVTMLAMLLLVTQANACVEADILSESQALMSVLAGSLPTLKMQFDLRRISTTPPLSEMIVSLWAASSGTAPVEPSPIRLVPERKDWMR